MILRCETISLAFSPTLQVCAAGYPCKQYHSNANTSDRSQSYRCCTGLLINLLKMLEVDVGFKSELHIVRQGTYGSRNKTTGEWSGVIGELTRGEADVALADLTISQSRSHVVDFSHPFILSGLAVMVAVKKTRMNWLDPFLQPYSPGLWIALVITINVVIVVLWLIDRLSPLGYRRRSTAAGNKKILFSLSASLWYTWGTIFHVDGAEARPKSPSARVITVCFAFAMTIMTTSYTACLAALFVSEIENYPVGQEGIRDPKV